MPSADNCAHLKNADNAPVLMQLDLLTRMRDHKIYENREHFQKHAEQPTNFSAFQIQEYLKASQFRYVALWRDLISATRSILQDGLLVDEIRSTCHDHRCRRQMESVKDAMNASVLAGAGGLVAKRIAAEEGREYILQVLGLFGALS